MSRAVGIIEVEARSFLKNLAAQSWAYNVRSSPDGKQHKVSITHAGRVVNYYYVGGGQSNETIEDAKELGLYWVRWYNVLDQVLPYKPHLWHSFLDWYERAYAMNNAAQARARQQAGVGEAKEFIKSLGRKPSVVIQNEYQYLWRLGTVSMTTAGSNIVGVGGAEPTNPSFEKDLLEAIHAFIQHLLAHGYKQLGQLDNWTNAERTHAVHRVLGKLIEMGALEEGPSRGDWNFYPIVGAQEPQQESTKDFIKGVAPKVNREWNERSYENGFTLPSGSAIWFHGTHLSRVNDIASEGIAYALLKKAVETFKGWYTANPGSGWHMIDIYPHGYHHEGHALLAAAEKLEAEGWWRYAFEAGGSRHYSFAPPRQESARDFIMQLQDPWSRVKLALKAAGFKKIPWSSSEAEHPGLMRIDAQDEENPKPGENMWQVTLWDKDMVILYRLIYTRDKSWMFPKDPDEAERRMTPDELVDYLRAGGPS